MAQGPFENHPFKRHAQGANSSAEEGGGVASGGLLGDAEIRVALRSWLQVRYRDDKETMILEELGLCRGQARLDMAVVNGLLHGYEIKSDRDRLDRLEKQIRIYGKVLDRATLVVGSRHVQRALSVTPSWWGILQVLPGRERPRFRTIRRGRKNLKKDPRALVELLWREDAASLLLRHDLTRGVRSKPRWVLWDTICQSLQMEEIATEVKLQLKARAAQRDLPTP